MPIEIQQQKENALNVQGDTNELSRADKSVVDGFLGFVDDMVVVANPKNWFVPDYSNKKDFGSAYAIARQHGDDEFLFNKIRYSTKYKGTPEQQLKETGITDNQIGTSTNARNFGKNGPIYNFSDPITTYVSAAFLDKKNVHRTEADTKAEKNQLSHDEKQEYDALLLSTGLPQKYNTFSVNNKYKPIGGKDEYYYSLNNDESFVRDKIASVGELKKNAKLGPKKNAIQDHNLLLGYYTTAYDKDERGEYIAYRDTWDLNPFDVHRDNNKLLKTIVDIGQNMLVGKPLEIYDRIYYATYEDGSYKQMFFTDKELLALDISRQHPNVFSLQKELANRGYNLPGSKKQDGNFDGVFGEETKNALLDRQNKHKKTNK